MLLLLLPLAVVTADAQIGQAVAVTLETLRERDELTAAMKALSASQVIEQNACVKIAFLGHMDTH